MYTNGSGGQKWGRMQSHSASCVSDANKRRHLTIDCMVSCIRSQYPTSHGTQFGMDFVGPFPESKGYNYPKVVICRLTSMVHLIPIHTTTTASELSWIYLREMLGCMDYR